MTLLKSIPRFAVLACVAILPTACSQSLDRHIYTSTATRPTTVTVYEVSTQQQLWTKEIPVGQTLMLDFDRAGEIEKKLVSLQPATTLKWKLYVDNPNATVADDAMDLPGTPISMKVTYRTTQPQSAPDSAQPY